MPDREIIAEKPISLVETKEILQKLEKREKELNFRAAKVKTYVDIFTSKDAEKIKKIKENLEKANITRLKSKQIVKILDFMPTDIDDLKSLLTGEDSVALKQEDLEKILEIIKK